MKPVPLTEREAAAAAFVIAQALEDEDPSDVRGSEAAAA